MPRLAEGGDFVSDLIKLGVSEQNAKSFYTATATPVTTTVGATGPNAGLGGQHTGVTIDGKTITLPEAPKTTGTGGGGATDPGQQPPIDWRSYLADWGFTPEITNELDRIFRVYTDPNQAGAAALAYIRGTQWYAQTFPGITQGIKYGLIGDEQGYRSYVNQLNQYYRRYFGRDVTAQEVSDFLVGGKNITQIGQHLQGGAFVSANRDEIQYELGAFDENGPASESDLSAYGDHLSGLDNMIGPQLGARLDKAKQRMNKILQGTLATPSLSLMNNGNLASARGANTSDVES